MAVSRIATAILAASTDPDIRALAFKKASYPSRATHGAALPPEVAMSYYKKDLDRVMAIAANPATDPGVLAKFVKDTRVNTRYALIRNPSLPYEGVLTIALWALMRVDSIVGEAFVRLHAKDFVHLVHEASNAPAFAKQRLSALAQLRGVHSEDWAVMAAKLAEEPELALKAAAFGNSELNRSLGLLALHGKIAGVSLKDVLAAHKDSNYTVLQRLIEANDLLTRDFAEAMVEHVSTGGYLPACDEPFKSVEPGAAAILLGGNHLLVKAALVNGVTPAELAASFASLPAAQLATVLTEEITLDVGADGEALLVQRYLDLGGEVNHHGRNQTPRSVDVLRYLRRPLPDEVLLEVLAKGSSRSTRSWIEWSCTGDAKPNGLRRGLIRALAANPGAAFVTLGYRQGVTAEEMTAEEKFSSFISSSWSAPAAVVPELVELFDTEIGSGIFREDVTKLVYPVLEATFGSDREAWETYMILGSDWNGSFTDLVAATCNLVGMPVTAAAVAATQEPETCEQLTLI